MIIKNSEWIIPKSCYFNLKFQSEFLIINKETKYNNKKVDNLLRWQLTKNIYIQLRINYVSFNSS